MSYNKNSLRTENDSSNNEMSIHNNDIYDAIDMLKFDDQTHNYNPKSGKRKIIKIVSR